MRLYILLGFLIVLAAAVGTAMFYRGQAIKADAAAIQLRADLQTAQSVNKQNQATIATLRDDLTVSQSLAKDLADKVEQIDAERDAANDELQALKEANEDVRNYLSQPIPDALRLRYGQAVGPR